MAKARLSIAGQLPPEYASRFGHPTGTDGQFLSFFQITKEDLLKICGRSDAAVAVWFLALPTVSPSRINEWNHLAVNLGRPGFPMAARLPIALATVYKHLAGGKYGTVFEILEADEKSD